MSEDDTQSICPYCGHAQHDAARCESCGGLFEPLSRQATQNAMGPWFIRDESQPFRPGCSYETLVRLVERGKVTGASVVRGPATKQFWQRADRVQGLAHLMNVCHACGERVGRTDVCCEYCGAMFAFEGDRQTLGLAPVRNIEAMATSKALAQQARAEAQLAEVGYDRLRAAVEAASKEEGGDAARAALSQAADDSTDLAGTHKDALREPRRRRIRKEQLTPGQLAVERAKRERRMFMIKAGVGGVIVVLAAIGLMWVLAIAGAITLPFAVPGVERASSPFTASPESDSAAEPGEASEAGTSVPTPIVGPGSEPPGSEVAALTEEQQELLDLYARGVKLVDGVTIADLEEAEAIFIRVRDELPESLHPESLAANLRLAQRRLEVLRLEEPPDG